MTTSPLISRKEIAKLIGETVWIVANNEARFGLDKCRKDINPRCVRYRRAQALASLAELGFLPNSTNSNQVTQV